MKKTTGEGESDKEKDRKKAYYSKLERQIWVVGV